MLSHRNRDTPLESSVRDGRVLAAMVAALEFFGLSAAVSGASAVVGARGDEDNGSDSGSLYLFDASAPGDCPCPWDLDANDFVGVSDLLLVLAGWGDPYRLADLLDLLASWGDAPNKRLSLSTLDLTPPRQLGAVSVKRKRHQALGMTERC